MQFTLRRLLLSITLIALGVFSATLWVPFMNGAFASLSVFGQCVILVFCWSIAAFICGGIGCLFNRTLVGIAVGYILLLVAMLI